jgi:hypothetical protein
MFKFELPPSELQPFETSHIAGSVLRDVITKTEDVLRENGINENNAANYYGRVEIVDKLASIGDTTTHREIFIDGNKVGEIKINFFE